MKNIVELMSLYWTTAGVFPSRGEISRFDFKDRVQAAAKAGFKGVGIWHTDLEYILQHRTLKEMKRILDDNGIKHVELEFITDWFLDSTQNISKLGIFTTQHVPCPVSLSHLRYYARRRRITVRQSVLKSWGAL